VAAPPVNVTATAPEFAGNPCASQDHALMFAAISCRSGVRRLDNVPVFSCSTYKPRMTTCCSAGCCCLLC
jgi:hypothetical protein